MIKACTSSSTEDLRITKRSKKRYEQNPDFVCKTRSLSQSRQLENLASKHDESSDEESDDDKTLKETIALTFLAEKDTRSAISLSPRLGSLETVPEDTTPKSSDEDNPIYSAKETFSKPLYASTSHLDTGTTASNHVPGVQQ